MAVDVVVDGRIFDETTVDKLYLDSTVTIQQVVIRNSNLSFPTAVLGLDTAVTTLYVEMVELAGEEKVLVLTCALFCG